MNIQTTASTGEGPDHTRPLVLVVDDEEPIRRALERHLDKLGYDVIATGDGDQAIELARSRRPAIILSDIYMPGMDGHTLLANLNRIGALSAVVLMSGQGELDDAISALREGAVDYMKKPWTAEGLAAVLGRAMGLAGALRERAGSAALGRALAAGERDRDGQGPGETAPVPDVAALIETLAALPSAELPFAEVAKALTVPPAIDAAASGQAWASAQAAALRQAFPIHTAGRETLANRIWRFSVARAIAMQELAEIADAELELPAPEYFQAGLLLDVGASYLLAAADRALAQGSGQVGDPVKLLAKVTAHHASVSAHLLRRWNLPASLEELAAEHHQAGDSARGRRAAEPLWCAAELGGAMAVRVTGFGDPTGDRLLSSDRLARCAYTLGVGDSSLRRLTSALTERANEIWSAAG